MSNQQNPYNSYNQPPQMPPMGSMLPPKKRTWKERLMLNYGQGMQAATLKEELTIPNWLIGRSVLFFFIAFAACTIVFGYAMPWKIAVVSCVGLPFFFYGAHSASRKWWRVRERGIVKKVFVTALVIRLVWVCISYFYLNTALYGKLDGFGDDNWWYMYAGKEIADWLIGNSQLSFNKLRTEVICGAVDDTGFPFLLAIEYLLSIENSDVFVPLLFKALFDSYTCVGVYRIAHRHFDAGTARMAALLMVYNPLSLFWISCILKECEMVCICMTSINLIDSTLSAGKKISFRGLLPGLAVGALLFFFRTALALVVFIAVFAHIIFVSHKVMSNGKKVLAGVMVAIVMLVGLGDRISMQSQQLMDRVQSGDQHKSMEWRAEREGGNSFAKYAGAAVFAPLIFTIPFPTLNMADEEQVMQMELAGGYYIKNILSFFVILLMLLLLISGEWRKHVFIEAYTVGYLVVLVMSEFAQSGRFHMPIFPMLMIFAAYGIQIEKGNKRIKRVYTIVLVMEVFVCLSWNWFKLKGRGMI